MNQGPNDKAANTPDDAYRVAFLIAGFIRESLSQAEMDELDEWVTASQENMQLFAELTDEKNIEKGLKERGIYDAQKALQRLRSNIKHRKKHFVATSTKWLRYGIAASIILVLALPVIFTLQRRIEKPAQVAHTTDLPPGGNKAFLTLSNGRRIVLDSSQQTISLQGLQVDNSGGELAYNVKDGKAVTHTLSTPAGGQYKLRLPDGTTVWLNAASSITYPTAFTGNERRVQLTGEAYFEVTHFSPAGGSTNRTAGADNIPFIVQANGLATEVLGTQFNIHAYKGEQTTITLAEGRVKVFTPNSAVMLKPGQQAVTGPDAQIHTSTADLEEMLAWKEGIFEFKNQPIENIMKQVARWYDAKVIYRGTVSGHFNASVSRDVPLSTLLHWLESTGEVQFEIHDKTIIVKP